VTNKGDIPAKNDNNASIKEVDKAFIFMTKANFHIEVARKRRKGVRWGATAGSPK